MNTYQEALDWASLLLAPHQIPIEDAAYVLEVRQNWTPTQRQLHRNDAIDAAVLTQFQADVSRLAQHEPAQYIVGQAPFFGRWFDVSPAVLIPRFETEELVAWVLDDYPTSARGIDVGTGSGVIGLTLLAERPQFEMTLVDVSPAALAVAKRNAATLKVTPTLRQSDLLTQVPDEPVDFVIANLPYIDRAEMPVMDESTKQFEPELALYAENHGLALFIRLFETVQAYVKPGGHVYLEFGYQQQPALARMIALQLPAALVEFRRDMAGQPRMVKITLD
ncbi:peptide chain release factor N(5)-glutamine methyltransferase [Lacticaseibacillus saniviri]